MTTRERAAIELRPLDEIGFASIVRDQRDARTARAAWMTVHAHFNSLAGSTAVASTRGATGRSTRTSNGLMSPGGTIASVGTVR